MKVCTKCKKSKPLSEFGRDKRRKDGLYPHCKECKRQYQNDRYSDVAAKRLERKYGITKDDYDRMFREQGGKCAICDKPQSECRRALAVDHCHASGKVRGLLCDECNRALGYFYDDTNRIAKAIEYLGGV